MTGELIPLNDAEFSIQIADHFACAPVHGELAEYSSTYQRAMQRYSEMEYSKPSI